MDLLPYSKTHNALWLSGISSESCKMAAAKWEFCLVVDFRRFDSLKVADRARNYIRFVEWAIFYNLTTIQGNRRLICCQNYRGSIVEQLAFEEILFEESKLWP